MNVENTQTVDNNFDTILYFLFQIRLANLTAHLFCLTFYPHAFICLMWFLSSFSSSGQVNPRGPELLGQLQDHDPRAVHCAWGAEGPNGAAQ